MAYVRVKTKDGGRYLGATIESWPSFCGGWILCNFRNSTTIPTWETLLPQEYKNYSSAAKALVEHACTTGALVLADRVNNIGHKYIISKLPRRWTNKTLGYTYHVHKSKVYKNSTHNSDVMHCTVYRTAILPPTQEEPSNVR